MPSNILVRCLTQKAFDDGAAEAKGGTFLGVPVVLLDARAAELGLQVGDGGDWVAAGHPKVGPTVTRLRAAVGARSDYECGAECPSMTLEEAKAAAGVVGLDLYVKAVEVGKTEEATK